MVDVLIIGSGGAGLSAALKAKEMDASVLVVSKTHPTHSQTCQAQGGINAVLKESKLDSNQQFFEDTYKSSRKLGNKTHITEFCKKSKDTISWLDSIGVPFSRNEKNQISQRKFGGTKAIRTCYSSDYTGLKILHTLYDQCIKNDIEFLNEHYLFDLIVEENCTKGAIFLDMLDSSLKQIDAKTVIIASGGYAGVYYNFTTNSYSSTGDGIATAFRCGAKLSNMEFVQFHPTALEDRNILISESARGEGAYLVDEKENRFIDELKPRDEVARAIFTKNLEGNRVFIDARHLGINKIEHTMPQERRLIHDFMKLKMEEDLIPVNPSSHYSMGGILTNITGESSIKNLFACGECSQSGIHGANRLGGNSLMEIVSLGKEVGLNASKKAIKIKDPIFKNKNLQRAKERLFLIFNKEKKEEVSKLKKELGKELFEKVGLFREEKSLMATINKIKSLKNSLDETGIEKKDRVYNKALIDILELDNMLMIAQTIVLSALNRKESRGAHYRTDFLEQKKEFDKNTILKLENNSIKIYFEEIK